MTDIYRCLECGGDNRECGHEGDVSEADVEMLRLAVAERECDEIKRKIDSIVNELHIAVEEAIMKTRLSNKNCK